MSSSNKSKNNKKSKSKSDQNRSYTDLPNLNNNTKTDSSAVFSNTKK